MSMVRPRLASRVASAHGAGFRTSRTWWAAALSFAMFALALAAGDALSQSGGCARCGSAPVAPVASVAATPHKAAEPRRLNRVALGFDLRVERPKWAIGSYVVCVRTCDGSFFPVSYFGGNPSDLQEVCQSLRPHATVALYSFPFGGVIDEAVSANGERYADLPNAHKFEQTLDARCSCRAPGQSWAQALAAAEAKYGHHRHDVLVTEEESKRLSRPRQDPNAKPAAPVSRQADAVASVEPGASLDINDVDTGLTAAAATMSRVTSGIEFDEGPSAANYGLHQGQTVGETGPDGRIRRVRILPPAF
jgi:Protein of unknown function (DUF2865)